jgi:hypothetical protein
MELLYNNKTQGRKGQFYQYNNQLVNLLVLFNMIGNHLIYSFFVACLESPGFVSTVGVFFKSQRKNIKAFFPSKLG